MAKILALRYLRRIIGSYITMGMRDNNNLVLHLASGNRFFLRTW